MDSSGNAINLTGVTNLQWQLIEHVTGLVVATKNIASGVTIIDAINGKLRVVIGPSDTAAIDGSYIHETHIIDASGNPITLSENSKLDDGIVVFRKRRGS